MRPPKTVSIVSQTYSLEPVDDARLGLLRGTTPNAVGAVDNDVSRIVFRSEASGDASFHQERDTVLHETIHALNYLLNIPDKESRVATLATGLLQVLRDNPDLVAYLTEGEPVERELMGCPVAHGTDDCPFAACWAKMVDR